MTDLLKEIGSFLTGDTAGNIYWVMAISGTALFALSGIMLFFGVGHDAVDFDSNMDGIPDANAIDLGALDLKFFTLRTILAFITMFGWGGVVWGELGWLGFLIALASGVLTMLLTAFVIRFILKMQQSGTVPVQDLIGRTGTVYLSIPGNKSAAGKVTLNIGSQTKEIQAFAMDAIPTGAGVKVTALFGANAFLVEKL